LGFALYAPGCVLAKTFARGNGGGFQFFLRAEMGIERPVRQAGGAFITSPTLTFSNPRSRHRWEASSHNALVFHGGLFGGIAHNFFCILHL
jgi:hypothetical protein